MRPGPLATIPDDAQLVRTLKDHWGHSEFRQSQLEIIRAILNRRDCMVMMATGSGKSLCYQLPVVALRDLNPSCRNVTICISPLISLMTDQVQGLLMNNVKACLLGAAATSANADAQALTGDFHLIYMTPEKVQTWSTQLRQLHETCGIAAIAIDECHCAVEWGHDFRPDYQRLSILREVLPDVPIVALTATATESVKTEIVRSLHLRIPLIVRTTVNRPNIHYTVKCKGSNRMHDLREALLQHGGSAIIYVATRREADDLAALISTGLGIKAGAYHGEMSTAARSSVYSKWSRDELRVMVATLAFGMGIDKGDVRLIINYGLPKSVEAYYQQTGRAGRDGVQSYSVLFWEHTDVQKQLGISLKDLVPGSTRAQAVDRLIRQMETFADGSGCRRAKLLEYFGERMTGECQGCDNCDRRRQAADRPVASGPNAGVVRGALTLEQYSEATHSALRAVSMNHRKGMKKVIESISKDNEKKGPQRSKQWWEAFIHQLASSMGLLSRETQSMAKSGSNWNTTYTSFALTTKGRNFLNRPTSRLEAFEASQQLFDAERSLRVDAQKKAATAALRAGYQADRQALIEERKAQAAHLTALQDTLFQRLKTVQASVAARLGVAAYTVISDATLKVMAEKRPITLVGLSDLDGWSEQRLQSYGTPFVEEIKAACEELGLPTDIEDGGGLGSPSQLAEKLSPTVLAAYEAFMKQGRSVDDIAQNRTGGAREKPCKPATIRSYLAKMADLGHPLDWPRVGLPDCALAAVKAAVETMKAQGVDALSPLTRVVSVRDHCPADTDYGDVCCALAWLRSQQPKPDKPPASSSSSSSPTAPEDDSDGWISSRNTPLAPSLKRPRPSQPDEAAAPARGPSLPIRPPPPSPFGPPPSKAPRSEVCPPAGLSGARRLYRPSYASAPPSTTNHPPPPATATACTTAPMLSPSGPCPHPPNKPTPPERLTGQAVLALLSQHPEGLSHDDLRAHLPAAARLPTAALRDVLEPLELDGAIYNNGQRYMLL